MKKFMDKAREAAQKASPRPSPQPPPPFNPPKIPVVSQPPPISAPIHPDIVRYRYNHGTNLGSVFVLEKWLRPSMFPKSCGQAQSSELEAVKANVRELGTEKARLKHEKLWNEAVTDQDWRWLSGEAKCTAVRLPIGYFTLGSRFCNGTPFAAYAKVYENAWSSVCRFVDKANSYGIGVLLDLHAVPGGANTADHSGSNANKAELWTSNHYKSAAVDCVTFLVQEARNMLGVVGIQVCNEADWGAPGMYDFYDWILSSVNSFDSNIPIYISDAWQIEGAIEYSLKRNQKDVIANPIIVDTHCYWAFADNHKQMSPQQIVDDVSSKLTELDGKEGSIHDRGAVQVVVGEYSAVMAGEVWQRHGDRDREQLVRSFGQAQSRKWQQRSSGSYFWTYTMDWLPSGEWGFVEQTKKGGIHAPKHSHFTFDQIQAAIQSAANQRDSLAQKAAADHANYWDSLGGNYEHWRFEPGWRQGYADAETFFTARMNGLVPRGCGQGGDRIGAIEVWVLKRCRESGMIDSGWMWEWEAGLRKGIKDFENVVGIEARD